MNRKQRRAAGKRRDNVATVPSAAAANLHATGIANLMAEARRYHQQGRISQAQEICRRILAHEPSHLQSLNLLGIIAQTSSAHRLAVRMFARAIAADEFNAACHYNIANSYQALNRPVDAIWHFKKALALGMNNKAVEEFIMQSPVIAWCLERIAHRPPRPVGDEEPEDVSQIAGDLFLRCALATTALMNMALEALLGHLRSELLRYASADVADPREVASDVIEFFCALAQQCFINEYVYPQSAEETWRAIKLRDRLLENLAAGGEINPLMLAAVAAYFPLHTLPIAEALLRRDWPEAAADLLQQQLRDPLEEARDRCAIAVLTDVSDRVSLQVMRQYEENPYPRWTINPLAVFAIDQAQGKTDDSAKRQAELEIMIAGCGTGLHAVQIAQVYPKSRVLGVDVSLASLAYARRKTRELGLRNIEYAKADILALGSIGRSFDRIESVGVLHHLAEPGAGWRVLLSLLRPGGEMRIGLYSEAARRVIVDARARIAERDYRPTADDIRRCRQEIIGEASDRCWKALIGARDFYTMSGCRDLLFNVMEHRFTIPEIAAFLNSNNLTFLGFEFSEDASVIEKFRRQFPGPSALTDLDRWQVFEAGNPQTFWGMYVFSLRKNVH
jgi:SAM-dependent methyltransferase/tetratricopeptide (TPR) repeat protein